MDWKIWTRQETRQDKTRPKSETEIKHDFKEMQKKKKLQQTNQTTSLHMNKNHVVFCFLLLFLSLVSLFGQKTEFNFKGAKTNKNKKKQTKTRKTKKRIYFTTE